MYIKLCYDEINKKIQFKETINELKSATFASFPSLAGQQITFAYLDEDGDRLAVDNDFDLLQCKTYLINNEAKSIKIFVAVNGLNPLDQSSFLAKNMDGNISYFEDRAKDFKTDSLSMSICSSSLTKEKQLLAEEQKKVKALEKKLELLNSSTANFVQNLAKSELFQNFQNEINKLTSFDEKALLEEPKPKEEIVIEEPKVEEIKKEPVVLCIHPNVRCDGCGISPIQGVRFKCTVCPNFDFCQTCKTNFKSHSHPFIAYDQPMKQFVCDPSTFKYSSELEQMVSMLSVPQPKLVLAKNALIAFRGNLTEAINCYLNS